MKASKKITNCLNSEEIKNSLNELNSCLNDITVPEAVSRLRQIFVNISDKSFEKTNFGKVGINKKVKHKKVPWMNEECKALKVSSILPENDIRNLFVFTRMLRSKLN